jgi:hypothetical protein
MPQSYNGMPGAPIGVKHVPSASKQKPFTQPPSHCASLWQARCAQPPALQSAFFGQSATESHFFGVSQRDRALHSVSGFEQGISGPQPGVQ